MELHFRRYDLKLAHNWMVASSQATGGKTIYPAVLLELRHRDGVIGFGEAAPSLRYQESADTAVAFLQRIDTTRLSFDDVDGSMRYVESLDRENFSPKGAINLALLDGAAKKASQPLYEFLGLSFGEGKHISSITIGLDSPEIIRRKTEEAEPFPILKLKVGAPNDAEILAALREVAPRKLCASMRMKHGRQRRKPCATSKSWPPIRTSSSSSSRCRPVSRPRISPG